MKKRNLIAKTTQRNAEVATSNVPEVGVEDEGKPRIPEERIRDGAHAARIFSQLEREDDEAEWRRSNIDRLVDGDLPFDPEVLRDIGQSDRTNVNFKEGKAEEDAAQTPYIEMTTQTDILWRVKTGYGDERERIRWNQIISEEHTRIHREWGADFHFYRLGLTQQFNRHGLAFLYWENELDWRWRTDGLSAFKIPRNTESRPSAIPYAVCKRSMPVNELYAFIRNERRAKEVGRWNVDAVKQAIVDCGTKTGRPFGNGAWEEFVREAKENDLSVGSTYQHVKLFHLWTKEFNDAMSHYICLQSGEAKTGEKMIGNGFLYRHRFRFPSLQRCIIPFAYGVGTHRTYHTIRGQGELNFGPISISNRLRCKGLDALAASVSVLLEVDTPADMENVGVTHVGPYLCVRGGKINGTALPDVSSRVLPALRDMQMLRQNLTGSFQARAVTEEGTQERTKYEVQAQQQQGSRLDSAAMTMFFEPWSQAGRETLRRLTNPKLRESDPGGREAFQFRLRCLKRGVPKEALEDIVSVDAVRTIGNGSPQMRQYSSEKIWSYNGALDSVGRKEALRMVISSIPGVGYDNAALLIGPDEARTDHDDEFAELENNDFRQGQQVPVLSSQNHWTHCQRHAALVTATVQAFEQQQIGGDQLVPILSAALDNMLGHADYLNQDATRVQEARYVRKFCQNYGGTLQQQEQKLIAQQQREQDASAQQQPQMSPEDQRKWESHNLDIQIRQQEFAMRQREFEQRLAQLDQDRHIKDVEAAAKLSEQTAKLNANGQ